MLNWLYLLFGATITGAAVAYVMAVPRRWLLLPFMLVPGGIAITLHGLSTVLAQPQSFGAIGMVVFLCCIGVSAGYWLGAASLALYAYRDVSPRPTQYDRALAPKTATIMLSFAAPERYRMTRTALHVRRLIDTDALRLPTSALPFVFLSERSRYRAIGSYLPARSATRAVAETVESLLRGPVTQRVEVAWIDGSPSLREVAVRLTAQDVREATVVVLGADGSLLSKEAILDLETTSDADVSSLKVSIAPSIWHSETLASRLVARILETTRGANPEDVGVVLVGEGQPGAWESFDREWRERENYFNQRVRLLLTDHAVRDQNVRSAWLEWQTPNVTEAVRHLAALGCTRVVIAPSTIASATLSTALDLDHMVASARVADGVRTVTLAPWGDDLALAEAVTDAIHRASRHTSQ